MPPEPVARTHPFGSRETEPRYVTVIVWSCNRCGQQIGQGSRPSLASCPHCGAGLQSITSAEKVVEGRDDPADVELVAWAMAAWLGVILVIAVVVFLMLLRSRPAESSRDGKNRGKTVKPREEALRRPAMASDDEQEPMWTTRQPDQAAESGSAAGEDNVWAFTNQRPEART
jgi:predicted  nucleic acid-binding Zn-ribbon protein